MPYFRKHCIYFIEFSRYLLSLADKLRRYSRFTFVENTVNNLPKAPRTTFLGSDGFFCFSSICQFGSLKNPVAIITSLPELYFRFRRFILLVQMKKMISMRYGSSISSWKPWRWMRLNLILTMMDIYITGLSLRCERLLSRLVALS